MKEKNGNGIIDAEDYEDTSIDSGEMSLITVPQKGINIERELAEIEKNIELFNRIKIVALKLTKPQDWVDQSGNPYLMDRGAENIATAFGVDVSGLDVKMLWHEDDLGRYYSFEANGKAYSKKLGRYVEDIGTCSQRDKFFGYDSKKKEFREIQSIDMMNVKKKAVTNLHVRLIKRVTGITNCTFDDLEQAGMDISKIGKIDYSKEKKLTDKGKEIREKVGNMILELSNNDKKIASDKLKQYSLWTDNDGKEHFVTSLKSVSEKWLMTIYGKVKADYEKVQYPEGEQQEFENGNS